MWQRRDFLKSTAAVVLPGSWGGALAATDKPIITRAIPPSGQRIPVIGMGSWLTFDVAGDAHALGIRVKVLSEFFARGGALIDSSPMYGTSQQAIGHCLHALERPSGSFAATKVWTRGRWFGKRQMKESARLWGVDAFDLMQVHNLVDVETHLETLKKWKADGRVKYVGATTSHGSRHEELEQLMRSGSIDFVQFTYNIIDREAEQRLLPLALERGIGVIINRPFRRSRVFDRVRGLPLPKWVAEFDCTNWAQFFLKFIVSHRAVTCAIPATSRVDHMIENMGALAGPLPDPLVRKRMAKYYAELV
jgi:diketogulonate reductase-like aldo/keto reductase